MKMYVGIGLIFCLAAALIAGCSNQNSEDNNIVNSPLMTAENALLPADAVLESAQLHIFAIMPSMQTVNIHRVTSSWDEMSATWNSYAGAYAPEVKGTFTVNMIGWQIVDVTDLVNGWSTGMYDNFGLLLDQDIAENSLTVFASGESSINQPILVVCYNTGSEIICDTMMPMMDTYVFASEPDMNYGMSEGLRTGYISETEAEMQSLLMFDVPVFEQTVMLGNYVWNDQNQNGLQDEGEPGYENMTINLLDCDGMNVLAQTISDTGGYYGFPDLEPGEYIVHFVLPDGYVFSPADQGTDDELDSDVINAETGWTMCLTLEAGQMDISVDAGVYMEEVDPGCTYSKGYWKNHAGFGPQDDVLTQYLPIWLGSDDGDKSLAVTTDTIAVDVLIQHVYGAPKNGIAKLYAQLLAAKLNIANGADDSDVADVISDTDEFLAMYDWNDWGDLSKEDQQMVNDWKSILDDYNNGEIGPGHCDWTPDLVLYSN
ncbi:MAG: SdrD B-like domain-containing protein [candidate division Zixibacteria bacterium]